MSAAYGKLRTGTERVDAAAVAERLARRMRGHNLGDPKRCQFGSCEGAGEIWVGHTATGHMVAHFPDRDVAERARTQRVVIHVAPITR